MTGAAETDRRDRVPAGAWVGLAVILASLVYALVDRQIFVILNEPIRAEMALSDTQMGLIQGVGLSLVGVLTTYPLAWLADRVDRRLVAAGCIAAWAAAVALCGLAGSFPWLLAGASIVGIGEAGIAPAALAMIPDLFPPSRLQLANSIYAVGARVGVSLALFAAGALSSAAGALRGLLPETAGGLSDWRLAFLIAAGLAPLFAALMAAIPRAASGRGRTAPASPAPAPEADAATDATSIGPFARLHGATLLGVFGAIGLGTFGFAAVATWVPVIAARYYGQTPLQVGSWMGAISLGAAGAGFLLGTPLLAALGARFGRTAPVVANAGLLFTAAICSAVTDLTHDAYALYGIWAVQATLLMLAAMTLPTMLQTMSPQPLRARVFAVVTTFQLVAGALSPALVGALSDRLASASRPLMQASDGLSAISMLAGGAVFWLMIPRFRGMMAALAEP